MLGVAVLLVAALLWQQRSEGVGDRRETAPRAGAGTVVPTEAAAHGPTVACTETPWRFRVVDEADEPVASAFAEPFLQGAESVSCKVGADGSGTIDLGLLEQERVRVSAPGHEGQVVDPRPDREVVAGATMDVVIGAQ